MPFTQLKPPPPPVIDPESDAVHGIIDDGREHGLIWVTAIDGTGEIWCAPDSKIWVQKTSSMSRERWVDKRTQHRGLVNFIQISPGS